MSSWFYKSLGDAMMAHGPSEQIREMFDRDFESAGRPAEMAIFTRKDEADGRLHCEVTLYFSPAAEKTAKAFDAQPCDPPNRSGLELLAGDPSCWSTLFP